MLDILEQETPEPRIFYVWPKHKDSFFGQTISEYDYQTAINEHCKDHSFKVIEHYAYEDLKQENARLREALEFYASVESWSYKDVYIPVYSVVDKSDFGIGEFDFNSTTDDNRVGGRRAREALGVK